ncbi:uncharacterized protein ACR2FA_005561, partial [Aphomia sociella]
IIITALIAVCGADKLDRTYLPPASAKTAGGSPGSLQTPLENSFNQGLGGLPKGSFTNDFQGVVVDAASAGTRASGEGETGLGAPRIAYGSTNSKVGDAAFRGSPAGFRQFDNSQFPADGQTADTNVSPQGFNQGPRVSQGFEKPERSQAARDRTAGILRYESNVGTDSYNYAFETDNGISAEESGVASNGVQAQGGYSYTGDDGQVYSVTYTADEGGYQPKGDHLPTPPPIPEEILKSLEQNAKEEAAGLVDDGSYDAQKYNAGGDYTDGVNREHNARQPSQFGNRPESDATASGTFINQNNQPFGRPSSNNVPGQGNDGSVKESTNKFESDGGNNFGQNIQHSQVNERPVGSKNVFANELQQNNKPQNGRPSHNGRPQGSIASFESNNQATSLGHEYNTNVHTTGNFHNGNQQGKPQLTPSFGRPDSSRSEVDTQVSSNTNNNFEQSDNRVNNFDSHSSNSNNGFVSNKEYLPPSNSLNQNGRYSQVGARRPPQNVPQQSLNQFSQSSSTFHSSSQNNVHPSVSSTASAFVTGSQKSTDNSQDFASPQNNFQSSNGAESSNRYSSAQKLSQHQADFSSKPAFNRFHGAQSVQTTGSFSTFQSQQPTTQPQTELTTPFESSPQSQNNNAEQQTHNLNAFGSLSTNSRPTQSSFGQSNTNGLSQFSVQVPTVSGSGFASTLNSQRQNINSRPSDTGFNTDQSSLFSSQKPQSHESHFNQQNGFSHNQPMDAQFSSSTQRPSFSQTTLQAQGPDDSYYYKQPSKTFNTPITNVDSSRFPGASPNQFNRLTQRPISSQNSAQVSHTSQPNSPINSFQTQNGQFQGSSVRYPSPPTLAPIVPTSSSQSIAFTSFNGVTQASASSFPSGAPTASTQFAGSSTQSGFGQQPTQQPSSPFNKVPQTSGQQLFAKQTTAIPQSFNDVSRNQFGQQANSFQNQQSQFGQRPSANINRPETLKDDSSQSTSSQQYDGEIYEYNKPAETLPAPVHKDTSESQRVQGGQTLTKPLFGHAQSAQSSDSSSDSEENQGRLPFGATNSRPQFGQSSQQNQYNHQIQNSRPQFGTQSAQFGSESAFDGARPTQDTQFAQSTNAPKRQPNSQQNSSQFIAQTNGNFAGNDRDSRPQFGLGQTPRPIGNIGQSFSNNQQPSRPQSGKPCCQQVNASIQPTQSSQFGGSTQGFGTQDTGFTVQSFKPGQGSTQSFAGKGEVFGGPRKPPSFDETGYHY